MLSIKHIKKKTQYSFNLYLLLNIDLIYIII